MTHENMRDQETAAPAPPDADPDRSEFQEYLTMAGLNTGLVEALLDFAEGRREAL